MTRSSMGRPSATGQDRATVAIGITAGETPVGDPPEFGRDPYGWFDAIRGVLAGERPGEVLGRMQPAVWDGPHGHSWRIIRTARGIEVRPDLCNPFLRHGRSPRVTAIAIGGEIEVELSVDGGHWVDRFPHTSFDVGRLGRAMLDEEELPHDNLGLLFPLEAR